MIEPKVSVIIPVHNRPRLVQRAIKSAINQNYGNLQIIVVDDASTDETYKRAKSFDYKMLECYKLKYNQGASAARNKGIKEAEGKYIAFLDSDDRWNQNKTKEQVCALEKGWDETGLVYTGMKHVIDDSQIRYVHSKKNGYLTRNLLTHNSVGSCSAVMVRASVYDKVSGFDRNLPARQDIDMWLRISLQYPIDFVDTYDTVVHKQKERNRISNQNRDRCLAFLRYYRKHKKLIEVYNKRGEYLRRVAHVMSKMGDKRRSANRFLCASLEENKIQPKAYALLILNVLLDY